MTDCRVSHDELSNDRPDILDHEDRMLAARQAMRDRVDEMLDTDVEGFETLEILFDSDDFMLALKNLLGARTHSGAVMPLIIETSSLANKVKRAAEAYLLELEELKS
jgi:hypothetical protein